MTCLVERLAELRRHLDLDRVVETLDSLAPVETFFAVVHELARESGPA